MKAAELLGKKINRLTVIGVAPRWRWRIRWQCQCECGNLSVVTSQNLLSGKAKSCGCYSNEATGNRFRKHGKRWSVEYQMWCNMIQRCTNPRDTEYHNYGGRGISVCESWHKFENFYADMGDAPKGLTIDRKDTNGNYEKDNCRWATALEQARNTRRNRMITHNGRTQALSAWVEETGLSGGCIVHRLQRGWTVAEALSRRAYA